MTRQTGITMRQIKGAPQKAIYVWVNSEFRYPVTLARDLNRADLTFVSPYWLENQNWQGRHISDIIIDHAVRLNSAQVRSLRAFWVYKRLHEF